VTDPDTRHDPVRGSGAEATSGPLGRVVVVADNQIARALVEIARATGWQTQLLEGPPVDVDGGTLAGADALVVCDHDGEGAYELLGRALRADVPYVAMMASRGRASTVLDRLGGEGLDAEALARLHVPAGLSIGGRSAGEIALSVMAEVVADAHGRDGGPLREQ
jgi:xanthine/CO dehydrogenase XdhC/CoxF family maturation factor